MYINVYINNLKKKWLILCDDNDNIKNVLIIKDLAQKLLNIFKVFYLYTYVCIIRIIHNIMTNTWSNYRNTNWIDWIALLQWINNLQNKRSFKNAFKSKFTQYYVPIIIYYI